MHLINEQNMEYIKPVLDIFLSDIFGYFPLAKCERNHLMSFKNSWDKILFAFDSRVVIKMMEREQRGLMQVGIMDHNTAWYFIHMQ